MKLNGFYFSPRWSRRFLASAFLILVLPTLCIAQSDAPIEVLKGEMAIDPLAERVFARTEGDRQATVVIGDVSITADEIEFARATNIVYATGDVKIWQNDRILRGSRLRVDLAKDEGELHDLREAELSNGVFFTGERLEYKPRPNVTTPPEIPVIPREYTLYNGTVTGNDLPHPHYYTEFERLVVVPDERYWVHNMVFHTQSVPVFYFPFYSQTLRENKVAYYIDAGHYSRQGTAIFNRLNIVPIDELEIDIHADYYTKAGIGKGARFTWDVPDETYASVGTLYGYHIKQEDGDNDNIFDGADRYNIAGQVAQELPYDMRLVAKGHKLSDSEYLQDFRGPERIRGINSRRIEEEDVSVISLTKRFDDQTLRLTAANRLDEFYYSGLPYIERKPQFRFEQYPYNLFNTNLYGELSLDYGRYKREQGLTYPLNEDVLFTQTQQVNEFNRFDANATMSYPFYLPERVTMEPWLGFRATQYENAAYISDDPLTPEYDLTTFDFDSETRLMGQGGLDISTRRAMEFDSFLDVYDRMRVVWQPSVEYGYYHPDTDLETLSAVNGGRFPYVDPTDRYRAEMHSVTTMMRARMQGKNDWGATSEFLSFGAGFAYEFFPDDNLIYEDFLFFDDVSSDPDQRFEDLIQEFRIQPTHWLSLGNTLRYDIDDSEIRSSYYYSNVQPIKPVYVTLGYYTFRYPFFTQEEQQDLVTQVRWDVSNKWQLYYGLRYDLDEGVFRRNNVGLVRDMYDFYAIFEIEHESHPFLGDDLSFQFGIELWGPSRDKPTAAVVDF